MGRTIKCTGISAALLLSLTASVIAQTAAPTKVSETASASSVKASDSAEKVVLKIGSEELTGADFDALISRLDHKAKGVIANKGRSPVAEEYIRVYLLAQAALQQRLDQDPALRMELQLQRDQILAQAEYEKITRENPVSDEAISQYFNAHSVELETVQTQEIVVRKKVADPNSKDAWQGMPAEKARATAESIRKALLKGADPAEATAQYSVASGVLLIDDKPRISHRTDMRPFLADAVFAVNAPGVTNVLENQEAFIVVKVFSHQKPDLKEAAGQIRVKLQREKLDAEVEQLKKNAGIWMDEEYFKEPLAASSRSGAPEASARRSQP